MITADIFVIGILLAAVALAARYIYKEKKRGARCVGCPFSGECSAHIESALSGCTLATEENTKRI